MTHDAATGFVGNRDLMKKTVKTQWVDLRQQLECGVRALDLRVVAAYEDFRQLHYHHTQSSVGWTSDQMVSDTIPSLIEWSRANPEELVVLSVSHCAKAKGPVSIPAWSDVDCASSDIVNVFAGLGVKVQTSCDTLNTWTLDEAKAFATMDQGGKMLMIPGEGSCVISNYDEGVKNVEDVHPYVELAMTSSLSTAQPFQIQSFLQQGMSLSVPLSSELNKNVYDWVTTTDLYRDVNLLEINTACAYASSISAALGASISSADANKCIDSCKQACKDNSACKQ